MAGAALLGLFGVWLFTQSTAGRLSARLLSWRARAPDELDPGTAPSSGPAAGPASAVGPNGWLWPVRGPITGRFAEPRSTHAHAGLDIAVPTGTPILAAGPGKVTYAAWNDGYGNFVRLEHGAGWTTQYGHMSKIRARAGAEVAAGTVIGEVGSTGNSTGPHLHFETVHNGTPQDPLLVIGGTP
jgi:murein DD-endopeptidase MepM/ murein hydrolase activator NlpD